MNIGVVTSGGDAPGMNPCLAQIVRESYVRGYSVFAYRRGFQGIRDNDYMKLEPYDVQSWYKLGGTMIKTSRMPELVEEQWQKELVKQLTRNSIDALIVLGGDGSFRGASVLKQHAGHLNIIGVPCTIDNNIYGSDYTLGHDTALNKQLCYIDDISDTGMAMPGRVFFVETLGAWDGYLANSSVLMGMADFSVLCENPMTNEEICAQVRKHLERRWRDYVLVTFAEGVAQMFDAAKVVEETLGVTVKCNLLGYQQRGGVPSATDRMHAAGFAHYAVRALEQGIAHKYIAYRNGEYHYLDLDLAEQKKEFGHLGLV